MKLRIQGNTLRLRLSQSDVQAFTEQGRVEERIRFGPGASLSYSLEASDAVARLSARYEGARITVLAPSAQGAAWARTDQVSLEGTQRLDGDEVLALLVEKDFECLHGPAERRDPDAFPHPLAEREP